jgi:hypothetical protein
LRSTGAESWPADIAPGTTFGPVLLDEGFEGGQVPPPGWSLVQTNERQTWVLSDLACEGDHAAVCDYDEQFGLQDEVLLRVHPESVGEGKRMGNASFLRCGTILGQQNQPQTKRRLHGS